MTRTKGLTRHPRTSLFAAAILFVLAGCGDDDSATDPDVGVDLGTAADAEPEVVEDVPCPDEDGDGTCDNVDVCAGGDDSTDSDEDGVPDFCDNCAETPNGSQEDADDDRVGDACDLCDGGDDADDADGDDVPDGCDVCEGFDDFQDDDADGVPNGCDVCDGANGDDTDDDGVPDACDLCADGDDAVDTDGDGVPDACDLCEDANDTVDSDGDGTPDACDLCADGDDAVDTDGDGIPDACDLCEDADDAVDSDGDGTPDACDECPEDEVDRCPALTCADGLENGDEDGIDCGGSCPLRCSGAPPHSFGFTDFEFRNPVNQIVRFYTPADIPYATQVVSLGVQAWSPEPGSATMLGPVRMGLYTDDAGVPDELVVQTDGPQPTVEGHNDFAVTTTAVEAGRYWVAFDAEAVACSWPTCFFPATDPGGEETEGGWVWVDAPDATFPTTATTTHTHPRRHAFYVTTSGP